MEYMNSVILPHILEALSKKPKLCDTYDNLCNEIEDILISDNRNGKRENIRKNIEKALRVGQSLGIITLINETIRVPFSLHTDKIKRRGPRSTASEDQFDDFDEPTFDYHKSRSTKRGVYDFYNGFNAINARTKKAFKAFKSRTSRKKTFKNMLSRSKRR